MFEKERPDKYKCKECKFFKRQFEEKTLNINGTIKKVDLWFPLCLYLLNLDTVYLATEKCKKFENKNKG